MLGVIRRVVVSLVNSQIPDLMRDLYSLCLNWKNASAFHQGSESKNKHI